MSEIHPHKPEVQLALTNDFPEICSLLDRANDYSRDISGLPGWHAMDHVYEGIRSNIEEGRCYIIRNQDGLITSSIGLSESSDIWHEAGIDGRALYFTKLIKDPALAQPGEGRQLLAFAAEQALARSLLMLRCDTVTELEGLIEYYEKLGFENKGAFVYETTGRPGVLLEVAADKLLSK